MAFNPFYIKYLTLFSQDIWSSPSRRYIFRSRKFVGVNFLAKRSLVFLQSDQR